MPDPLLLQRTVYGATPDKPYVIDWSAAVTYPDEPKQGKIKAHDFGNDYLVRRVTAAMADRPRVMDIDMGSVAEIADTEKSIVEKFEKEGQSAQDRKQAQEYVKYRQKQTEYEVKLRDFNAGVLGAIKPPEVEKPMFMRDPAFDEDEFVRRMNLAQRSERKDSEILTQPGFVLGFEESLKFYDQVFNGMYGPQITAEFKVHPINNEVKEKKLLRDLLDTPSTLLDQLDQAPSDSKKPATGTHRVNVNQIEHIHQLVRTFKGFDQRRPMTKWEFKGPVVETYNSDSHAAAEARVKQEHKDQIVLVTDMNAYDRIMTNPYTYLFKNIPLEDLMEEAITEQSVKADPSYKNFVTQLYTVATMKPAANMPAEVKNAEQELYRVLQRRIERTFNFLADEQKNFNLAMTRLKQLANLAALRNASSDTKIRSEGSRLTAEMWKKAIEKTDEKVGLMRWARLGAPIREVPYVAYPRQPVNFPSARAEKKAANDFFNSLEDQKYINAGILDLSAIGGTQLKLYIKAILEKETKIFTRTSEPARVPKFWFSETKAQGSAARNVTSRRLVDVYEQYMDDATFWDYNLLDGQGNNVVLKMIKKAITDVKAARDASQPVDTRQVNMIKYSLALLGDAKLADAQGQSRSHFTNLLGVRPYTAAAFMDAEMLQPHTAAGSAGAECAAVLGEQTVKADMEANFGNPATAVVQVPYGIRLGRTVKETLGQTTWDPQSRNFEQRAALALGGCLTAPENIRETKKYKVLGRTLPFFLLTQAGAPALGKTYGAAKDDNCLPLVTQSPLLTVRAASLMRELKQSYEDLGADIKSTAAYASFPAIRASKIQAYIALLLYAFNIGTNGGTIAQGPAEQKVLQDLKDAKAEADSKAAIVDVDTANNAVVATLDSTTGEIQALEADAKRPINAMRTAGDVPGALTVLANNREDPNFRLYSYLVRPRAPGNIHSEFLNMALAVRKITAYLFNVSVQPFTGGRTFGIFDTTASRPYPGCEKIHAMLTEFEAKNRSGQRWEDDVPRVIPIGDMKDQKRIREGFEAMAKISDSAALRTAVNNMFTTELKLKVSPPAAAHPHGQADVDVEIDTAGVPTFTPVGISKLEEKYGKLIGMVTNLKLRTEKEIESAIQATAGPNPIRQIIKRMSGVVTSYPSSVLNRNIAITSMLAYFIKNKDSMKGGGKSSKRSLPKVGRGKTNSRKKVKYSVEDIEF